jgi:hypothetical protein
MKGFPDWSGLPERDGDPYGASNGAGGRLSLLMKRNGIGATNGSAYLITSLRRAVSTVSPSALAVFNLITTSNMVGCTTWQVGRLFAFEDATDIGSSVHAPIVFLGARIDSPERSPRARFALYAGCRPENACEIAWHRFLLTSYGRFTKKSLRHLLRG